MTINYIDLTPMEVVSGATLLTISEEDSTLVKKQSFISLKDHLSVSTQSAVSASAQNVQVISPNVSTPISFINKHFDLGSEFSTSIFTAKASGLYQVSAIIALNSAKQAFPYNPLRTSIYKNSISYERFYQFTSSEYLSDQLNSYIDCYSLLMLDTSDTIQIRVTTCFETIVIVRPDISKISIYRCF